MYLISWYHINMQRWFILTVRCCTIIEAEIWCGCQLRQWKAFSESLAAASFFSKYLQLEGSYSKSHCWPQSGVEQDRIYQLLIWEINTHLCFEQEIDRFTNSAIFIFCAHLHLASHLVQAMELSALYTQRLNFASVFVLIFAFFLQFLKTPNQVVFAVSPFVLYPCLIFLPWGTADWFWRYI